MKAFFSAVREHLGPVKQNAIPGFEAVYEANKGLPVMHQAYIIATCWHETAFTMQPIYEIGQRPYFDKYEPTTKIGKALGNTQKGDGYLYRGRGFVQLTGRRNYELAGQKLGLDLVKHPDKALDLSVATQILVRGMVEGWFTGKKLSDFKTFEEMRRVVNGTDRAKPIADYARVFQSAVLAQAAEDAKAAQKPVQPVPVPPAPVPPQTTEKPGKGLAAVIGSLLAAAFAALVYWITRGGN
jgi:putative chitinase